MMNFSCLRVNCFLKTCALTPRFVNHTDQLFSRLSARFAVHATLGLNVRY